MPETDVSHGRCPRRAATAEPCVFCGDHALECAAVAHGKHKVCVAVCEKCWTDIDQEKWKVVATHLGLVMMP